MEAGPTTPRLRTDFPYRVRELSNEWIELSDGCRLAARVWLPEESAEDPGTHPVPAILEYLPYRKSDGYAWQDSTRHPYFAGHGYASVRVDIRGSGDSEGLLLGEYLQQELDDALEVIEWLGRQPWCSGEVGMIGYSWGGFNSLQVAMRRPPRLKAIVAGCTSDDRYRDDCHYMGGCLLGSDMLKWASHMLAISALPPDPLVVGERWRELWQMRLEGTPAFAEDWVAHQRYDAFWKHGSVAEDYEAIECAVLAFGGWTDAYTNGIPRLLERLTCPRKGVIGPWGHMFPERGVPGPAIGFLQECVRWWDQWLKRIDAGVMDEPMLRAWIEDPVPPKGFYAERPGRWIAEESWPPGTVTAAEYALASDGRLGAADARASALAVLGIVGSQVCGEAAGVWCSNGLPDELALDQRADDERSLVFDTEPLAEDLQLLGFPIARLSVTSDRPLALVAARLCDVAPNGESTLVTWGQLNLAHRDSSEGPAPLVPAAAYDVRVQLNAVGFRIPAGHRLRLAISPTYWPHAWPSPDPVRLTLAVDGPSVLELPLRTPPPDDGRGIAFGPPEESAPLAGGFGGESTRTRRVAAHDHRHEIRDHEEHATRIGSTASEYRVISDDVYSIAEDDPLSATVACTREYSLERASWSWRVRTQSEMTCDATSFHLSNRVEAWEGGVLVHEKTRRAEIPRDHL